MSIHDDQRPINPTGFDPDFASAAGWADMYRACGLQVVPSKKKHPDLHKWADLQDVIAPAFTFERWYGTGGEHATNGNMGIITGPCSGGVFVIDIDEHLKPEAAAWWRDLIEYDNGGVDPETPEQRTGGGGRQKLFRAPPGCYVPTRKTGIGIDIRGTGGFAVMPPTLHDDSKRHYEWLPLAGPWEREIALAEPWLLEAIEALTDAHGGDQGPRQRTASPAGDYTAFGSRQDGREDEMFRAVFHETREYYREVGSFPIKPSETAWMPRAMQGYEAYEIKVASRYPDMDKRAGLERDGRGPTEWLKKWRREMRNWGSPKMQQEAAQPNPRGVNSGQLASQLEPPKIDPKTGKELPLILAAKQFALGFEPPAYLIDGILQRGYLWALTASTHHGKTAVAMYMAQCIARGQDMHSHRVKKGAVLFLAGENSQDIRARFLVLAETYRFDPHEIDMYFIDGVVDLLEKFPVIKAEADAIGDLRLVIVDTAAAYFLGDETNSNAQQGAFARVLRKLTGLRGRPAVLVNCHPVKKAQRDNLLPMGGSAFLNEIDGNLTLWLETEKQTVMHWQGKFRGPDFEPLNFDLRVSSSAKVHDEEGRLMPSVVAVPIANMTLEAGMQVLEADENRVLEIIHRDESITFDNIAQRAGFSIDGRPSKSKVQRIIKGLVEDKFLVKHRRGKYRLTRKGRREIGADDGSDEE